VHRAAEFSAPVSGDGGGEHVNASRFVIESLRENIIPKESGDAEIYH
jgi:hypothetical protein